MLSCLINEDLANGEEVGWHPIWKVTPHKRQTRRLVGGVATLALTPQDPENRAVPAFAIRKDLGRLEAEDVGLRLGGHAPNEYERVSPEGAIACGAKEG